MSRDFCYGDGLQANPSLRQPHAVGDVHSWFLRVLQSGEFTAMPSVNRMLLTPVNVQVDSRTDPTFMTVTLHGTKTDPYG